MSPQPLKQPFKALHVTKSRTIVQWPQSKRMLHLARVREPLLSPWQQPPHPLSPGAPCHNIISALHAEARRWCNFFSITHSEALLPVVHPLILCSNLSFQYQRGRV